MIKLITIDMDGTLLKDNKELPKENIDAINYAKEKGATVVIATGRPIKGVYRYLEKLNLLDGYVILYNGAIVLDVKNNKIIYNAFIDGKTVKMIYEEANKLGLFFHAFKDNEELILPIFNKYSLVEVKINQIAYKLFDFKNIKDDDMFLKCMMVDSFDNLNNAEKVIDSKIKDNYSMLRSSPIFLEFLNKNADKGQALIHLAKYLGIKEDETMAIGDAGNDIPMIKKAHIGVAMKNAFDEAKKCADYITDTNENYGVAKAIYKFI